MLRSVGVNITAAFFGVTTRTIWGWVSAGVDITDPASIERHVLTAITRPARGIHLRIKEGKISERLAQLFEEQKDKTTTEESDGLEGLTLKEKKVAKEVELLDLKIQQQKGELVSRSLMREQGQRVGALIVAELAAMANDAPGQLAGADEATIRDRLESRFAVLIGRLRASIAEIDTVGVEQ